MHSCDAGEEPCYAGVPMSTIIEQGYGVGDVISLLWFKRSLPRYCTQFIEVSYGHICLTDGVMVLSYLLQRFKVVLVIDISNQH